MEHQIFGGGTWGNRGRGNASSARDSVRCATNLGGWFVICDGSGGRGLGVLDC